ncbi:hypothetical protein MSAN_02131100 [Mycena sanguinolenta]|uniref:Uncharacterized protein n=1 Tax=Mycena sanguinolenta TaxID=230812 RepID=A0A8H6XHE6_9AGAR|nr:hypothetical protein MSAN_02131100 [Mycena sanguinolenta]
MAFAFLPFPYLRSYDLLAQFIILLFLVALSYRYPRFRLGLFAVLGVHTTYKIAFPLVRWGYWSFKAIAMFGFYVYFFLIAVGYISSIALAIWNFPEALHGFAHDMENRSRGSDS